MDAATQTNVLDTILPLAKSVTYVCKNDLCRTHIIGSHSEDLSRACGADLTIRIWCKDCDPGNDYERLFGDVCPKCDLPLLTVFGPDDCPICDDPI